MLIASDAEITRRYVSGQSTHDIARHLNVRVAEVIGRVRALRLQPPGMDARRPSVRAAAFEPAAGAAPRPAVMHAGTRRPAPETPSCMADDDQNDTDFVSRAGCPRGWLISEEDFTTMFRHAGGRFEDVVIKHRRPVAKPVKSLSGQVAA